MKKVLLIFFLLYGLVFSKIAAQDQLSAITGKVVSGKDGGFLPGATLVIKGTTNGTVTDVNGNFTLNATNSSGILVASYIGFLAKEIPFKAGDNIKIALDVDETSLEEIVVIGYGTQQRKDLTGSVGQVNVEDMQKAPVLAFDQALAGRIAGVQVSSADGQPGQEGTNIIIRGANSLTQSNAPLYVIDGFPTEYFQNSSLNPDEIKSITVLKDASATAIYGARGANGVVVIETKKGHKGKPQITFNSSYGIQRVAKTIPTMNAYEFVRYELERNPIASEEKYLSNGKTLEDYRNAAGIDWQRMMYQDAPMQLYNLSMRGGTDQTKYSFSGSVSDQKGVIINTGQARYQARLTLDQDISEKVNTGINVNFSRLNNYGQLAADANAGSGASSYLLYSLWGYRPITASALGNNQPSELEEELIDDDLNHTSDFRVNPIISAKNSFRKNYVNNVIGNGYVNYNIRPNIKLRISGGLDIRFQKSPDFYNSLTSKGTPLLPVNIYGQYGDISFSERSTWINENTLTWNKTFNEIHKVETLAGVTWQGSSTESFNFSSQQVPNEQLGIYDLGNGIPLSNSSSASASKLASFLGRINYSLKSKFLFTGSFRADGSSRFSSQNRWAYFPSGAFAWRLDEEPFIKNIKVISEAKVRTSYGVTGNNRVGDNAQFAELSLPLDASYSFNNASPSPGVIQTSLGNQALQWETTAQSDIGMDLGLFNNRFSLAVDVYRKTTSNLLLNANLPYTTGFNTVFKNIGKTRNQGLEISLNTSNILTKSFSWESSFNISFNNNKILALAENQYNLLSRVSWESYFNNVPLYIAGLNQPAAMYYGHIWDGVYGIEDFDVSENGAYTLKLTEPTNGTSRSAIQPGYIKYKDLNGDGVVNENDRTNIGRTMPIHTGGFNNTFKYKGLSLNVFLQWVYGNQIYNANRMMFEGNSSGRNSLNQYASYTRRWTLENQESQMFRAGGQGPTGYYSDLYLEDGSFVRLKTVVLGYDVPGRYVNKAFVKGLNIHLSAQNLYTWTNYSGMDPEVSVRNSTLTPGLDFSAYPRARTLVFGLKASF